MRHSAGWVLTWVIAVAVVALSGRCVRADAATAEATVTFDGEWQSSFGLLKLTQTGGKVEGEYENPRGTVTGSIDGRKLTFTYKEAATAGEGWFELAPDGKGFAGKWRPNGAPGWAEWTGTRVPSTARDFTGLWETSFGRMRLRQAADGKVRGCYSWGGRSAVEGTVTDGKFTFAYQQPDGEKGSGTFTLEGDGGSFAGEWTGGPNGVTAGGGKWTGRRVEPQRGKVWLVVLEAPWERDLSENEYSYGLMLRTFFARVPRVQVRHRMIHSEADLRRWCSETTYLAEPVVLYFSSHGTRGGLSVGGKTIGVDVLSDALKDHADLMLLHFGSCLVAGGDLPAELQRKLAQSGAGAAFPISGFKLPADWAGSAVIDFTYLDLILSHNLSPAKAAEQTRRMITFANDQTNAGDAVPPAGLVVIETAVEK